EVKDGTYVIPGNSYVLRNEEFSFDMSSRAVQTYSKDFHVPGHVAYWDISAHSWQAKPNWSNAGNHVKLWAVMQGSQTRPFGPREPGYYRGSVRVYYTAAP